MTKPLLAVTKPLLAICKPILAAASNTIFFQAHHCSRLQSKYFAYIATPLWSHSLSIFCIKGCNAWWSCSFSRLYLRQPSWPILAWNTRAAAFTIQPPTLWCSSVLFVLFHRPHPAWGVHHHQIPALRSSSHQVPCRHRAVRAETTGKFSICWVPIFNPKKGDSTNLVFSILRPKKKVQTNFLFKLKPVLAGMVTLSSVKKFQPVLAKKNL